MVGGGVILKDVMAQIATQLNTITGLRAFGFPIDSATPPAALVSYPEVYEYDATYGRGMDRIRDLPVVVVVGKPHDRSTLELLGKYVDGSGAASVKQVIEAGTYTAFEGVRVTSAEFDVVNIAGTDYMAALFRLDIAGEGAS